MGSVPNLYGCVLLCLMVKSMLLQIPTPVRCHDMSVGFLRITAYAEVKNRDHPAVGCYIIVQGSFLNIVALFPGQILFYTIGMLALDQLGNEAGNDSKHNKEPTEHEIRRERVTV